MEKVSDQNCFSFKYLQNIGMEKVFEGNFDQNCYSLEKSPKTIFGKLPLFYKICSCDRLTKRSHQIREALR